MGGVPTRSCTSPQWWQGPCQRYLESLGLEIRTPARRNLKCGFSNYGPTERQLKLVRNAESQVPLDPPESLFTAGRDSQTHLRCAVLGPHVPGCRQGDSYSEQGDAILSLRHMTGSPTSLQTRRMVRKWFWKAWRGTGVAAGG